MQYYFGCGKVRSMSNEISTKEAVLARQIVSALFTNGSKQRATRLQLKIMLSGENHERDGGGWGEEVAEAVVLEILNKSKSKEKK